MAVGASIAKSGATAGLAEAWAGASWRITVTPHPASANRVLFSVSCAGAARCLALGSPVAGVRRGATLTLQWQRGQWHRLAITGHQIPDFVPGAISCAAAARCEAVGYSLFNNQPGALTWNGTALRFLPVTAPAVGPLFAISCSRATRCVSVGGYAKPSATTHNGALAELWTGTTWKPLPITG